MPQGMTMEGDRQSVPQSQQQVQDYDNSNMAMHRHIMPQAQGYNNLGMDLEEEESHLDL